MGIPNWRKEYFGLGSWRPQFLQPFATVQWFTFFTAVIIGVQGIYLGHMIGVLTTIEKRFEIPSTWSGALLSIYDVGHAVSVFVVGHYGSTLHQPKWIAGGAVLSSIACFGLFLPHSLFGSDQSSKTGNTTIAIGHNEESLALCYLTNNTEKEPASCSVSIEAASNQYAYVILAIFQLIAGIASSPFTTLAYVYIDDNATRKQSPFYMGIATAMWAYGPALGFGLSSYTTQLWITLQSPPAGLTAGSADWLGAWWLGLVVLCALYLIAGLPFLFYPKSLRRRSLALVRDGTGDVELMTLQDLTKANSYVSRKDENTAKWCWMKLGEIPTETLSLVRNPMFAALSLSGVAGAYIFGGYSTFLPKFLEVNFYQPTFVANILGGIVAVIGVATSTAIGGKVLTYLNPKASKALMFVIVTFIHSFITYIILMFISCDNPSINGLAPEQIKSLIEADNFSSPVCASEHSIWLQNDTCFCNPIQYWPVCDRGTGQSYYSPCYLGCRHSTNSSSSFENCICASGVGPVEPGLCENSCKSKLAMYLVGSFLGGAVGAFFQMGLFTNLIWSVPKEKKTNAVALGNFFMSVFGFMPSQVLFGKIFDSACTAWNSDPNSSCDSGHCLLYDNRQLRFRFHSATAAFQFSALVFVLIAFFVSRNFPFPKHDDNDDENGPHEENQRFTDVDTSKQ